MFPRQLFVVEFSNENAVDAGHFGFTGDVEDFIEDTVLGESLDFGVVKSHLVLYRLLLVVDLVKVAFIPVEVRPVLVFFGLQVSDLLHQLSEFFLLGSFFGIQFLDFLL